jgi:hypothetical protein
LLARQLVAVCGSKPGTFGVQTPRKPFWTPWRWRLRAKNRPIGELRPTNEKMPPKPRRRSDLLQVQVEITEEQLDTLISDRPWSPLPADLETVVTQLPQTEPRCVRSTVLAWAHRHQGLIGYSQVHGALTGYRDLRAARKHAASILNLMSKQRLLSRVHFAADAPKSDPDGTNEGTAFEMTAAGVIYLRGACLARQKLALGCGMLTAHTIISEEEDGGRAHELHYLPSVIVRDAAGRSSTRQRMVNSVFGLA